MAMRFLSLLFLAAGTLLAQIKPANYDEAKVPAYTLPDVMAGVKTRADWKARRAEILKLLSKEMYGRMPASTGRVSFRELARRDDALGGKAVRKEIAICFQTVTCMELLVYLPRGAKGPVPVFLGLNYGGNQGVTAEPDIRMTSRWLRVEPPKRGGEASRWPVELAISRGYGIATAYYGDIDPDFDDGFRNGVNAAFGRDSDTDWGSVAAWAWGLSRAMDYLESDREADSRRVAVVGHSRLGKAALWAGATDERFAMVVSNDSGAGGAALSKRIYGEQIHHLNTSFPHWFAQSFRKYDRREADLPFDSHWLLATIAPRALYVASATEDRWADPKGEMLGLYHAGPVFQLLGREPLPSDQMPEPGGAVVRDVGYHYRIGKHDINAWDWERYFDFADRQWAK